jgi:hypothetical protein
MILLRWQSLKEIILNNIVIFDEPKLEFAYGQKASCPKIGLTLFGPADLNTPNHPGKIHYACIGEETEQESISKFLQVIKEPVLTNVKESLWPMFPGFQAVFHCDLPDTPASFQTIDSKRLDEALAIKNPYDRTKAVVDLYIAKLTFIKHADEKVDVVFCIVPDKVERFCRPTSVKSVKTKNDTSYNVDFRRQLKARAMGIGLPIQILQASTLRPHDEKSFGEKGLTPLTDRAWNLATTLYYKVGGKPWKLNSARDGVCYIGLSFVLSDDKKSACCAAQMFLNNGDGVVFRGEDGPWYSEEEKFRLTEEAAYKLLAGVIDSYQQHGGKPLKEIFLHSHSYISPEEYKGYQRACPEGSKLVIVRVHHDSGFRLMRTGAYPIRRGAFVKLSDKSCYLFGSGYKELLGTYDGREIPIPLRVDIMYGEAVIEEVANDILGLTKLNFNACKLGSSQPVTIGYSKQVGEILVKNNIKAAQPLFKFYI